MWLLLIGAVLIVGTCISRLFMDYQYNNETRMPQQPTPELRTYSQEVIDAVVGTADAAVLNVLPNRIISTAMGGLPCICYATTCDENNAAARQKLERALAELTLNSMVYNVPDYQYRNVHRPVLPCIIHWQEDMGGIYWLCVRYAVTAKERAELEATARMRGVWQQVSTANTLILPD